jgi:CelD/BcsL family acetyltransferase involved in cellulose biosynthesis
MRKACENGTLRICFIDIDNTPVSMHIAVESDDAFWVLKLGYDESLAKCSPGAQLAMDTIEYSVRQGIARYEFLGSQESWQQAWPIKKHVCFTLLIYPYSLRGLLGFFGFATGYAKKQLLRLFAKT